MRNILQKSLATALLAFIVTGCNNTPSSSPANEQPNQTQPTTAAQELDHPQELTQESPAQMTATQELEAQNEEAQVPDTQLTLAQERVQKDDPSAFIVAAAPAPIASEEETSLNHSSAPEETLSPSLEIAELISASNHAEPEAVVAENQISLSSIDSLIAGEISSLLIDGDEFVINPSFSSHELIFPGSFNPIHQGHVGMAKAALEKVTEKLGVSKVILEISITNVDKPGLELAEINHRIHLIQQQGFSVLLTRAPRFYDKARLFLNAGATFVLGTDTAERLLNPKYCGGDAEKMISELAEMKNMGIRFLVAGRVNHDGAFVSLENIEAYQVLPAELAELFEMIPDFRKDISSTELRHEAAVAVDRSE